MSRPAQSLIGLRFGRVIVIKEAPSVRYLRPAGSDQKWATFRRSVCKCDCGKVWISQNSHLLFGHVLSCGCYRRDDAKRRMTTHGLSNTPEFDSWQQMKVRCLVITNKDYPRWGGRGIRICKRWMVFESFIKDMGPRPPGTTIDRKNNNGHYSPANCRWATRTQQQGNRRTTRLYHVCGVSGWLHALSRHFGVNPSTISRRIERGWSHKRAFTEALHKNQYY